MALLKVIDPIPIPPEKPEPEHNELASLSDIIHIGLEIEMSYELIEMLC